MSKDYPPTQISSERYAVDKTAYCHGTIVMRFNDDKSELHLFGRVSMPYKSQRFDAIATSDCAEVFILSENLDSSTRVSQYTNDNVGIVANAKVARDAIKRLMTHWADMYA